MPRLAATALCALVLLVQSALADIRGDMTALIRADDRPAILAALSSADPAAARQAYGAFHTARADAGRVSAALLAAHPDDPRAMVARGWHLQATGWAMRGENFVGNTFREALDRMAAMHGEALALADAALAADPGLIPASDLVLSLARTTGQGDRIAAELDRVMTIWPNRQSMILAIGGMTPNWGGPEGWGYAACDRYADRIRDVPGYTQAVCEVDILFAAPYPFAYREAVFDRIPGLDHPILDDARYQRATSGRVPAGDAIATLERMLAEGKLGPVGADILDNLRGQAMPVVGGPAVAAVIDGAVARMRADCDFNPGDGNALRRYIGALGVQSELRHTPFPRDEIIARYAARFAVAPYDGKTWSGYGDLMAAGLDWEKLDMDKVATVRSIYENGVFYTNHETRNLRSLDTFNRTVWEWIEMQRRDSTPGRIKPALSDGQFEMTVVCPAIRAIRVHAAVCENRPGEVACPDPDDPSDRAYALIAKAREQRACTAELEAPLDALAYEPVSVHLPQGK